MQRFFKLHVDYMLLYLLKTEKNWQKSVYTEKILIKLCALCLVLYLQSFWFSSNFGSAYFKAMKNSAHTTQQTQRSQQTNMIIFHTVREKERMKAKRLTVAAMLAALTFFSFFGIFLGSYRFNSGQILWKHW